MKDNYVARATFYHLAEMTPSARRQIARWLRQVAKDIESNGQNYWNRFTAKFYWE